VRRSIIGLLIVVTLASILGSAPARAANPLPKDDPFYAAPVFPEKPEEWPAPGTLLRSRAVSIAAFGSPLPFQAWQLAYVSRDAHGRPAANVTTVILPLNEPTSGPRPLVSYQTAEDSLSMRCAPSYRMREGTEKEEVALPLLLAQGWAVVVPDYEGLESQYTAGVQAGQAVIDSIRAALHFAPAGLDPVTTPVGLWGYSGGGLATAWATELAPSYAPELALTGVAEGGVPPDITKVAKNLDGGAFSAIELAGTVGMSRAYPELKALFNDAGRTMATSIGEQCIEEYTSQFSFETMDTYTTVANAIDLPWVQQIMERNRLGQRKPAGPIFIYHAINDELIPIAEVNALVATYCSKGVTVAFDREVVAEHISLAFSGAPAAVSYLASRFAGIQAPSTCALPSPLR
jgi:dienelactone hydrolase